MATQFSSPTLPSFRRDITLGPHAWVQHAKLALINFEWLEIVPAHIKGIDEKRSGTELLQTFRAY